MRIASVLFILLLLLQAVTLRAADELLVAERADTIALLLEQAMGHNLIAGGVVLVGNRDGVLFSTGRGRLPGPGNSALLDERTIFDVASLTKVLATTPAVMKLLEQGQIGLMDPLTRWFPEFGGSGREDITILNLLTHTSGLSDVIVNGAEPLTLAIREAALRQSWRQPGRRFHYADINFILLGELVRRVSGYPLDAFCREQINEPLGIRDTWFRPPDGLAPRIAPTLAADGTLGAGQVQDTNARSLGGVAGHAGLFSSAADIARFVRMILNGGELDGQRVFSDRVVTQMTAPYFYSDGRVVRGLGWDITSPFSAPKGNVFSDMSFGHTGYSGASLWVDPQRDIFVILLTIRLNYRDTRLFNRLRGDISRLAVAAFPNGSTARSVPAQPASPEPHMP